jgi:hypothetical protein
MNHPVHDYLRSRLSRTELDVINLIKSNERQFTLSAIQNVAIADDTSVRKLAADFFDHVREKSWRVVEEMYDDNNFLLIRPGMNREPNDKDA